MRTVQRNPKKTTGRSMASRLVVWKNCFAILNPGISRFYALMFPAANLISGAESCALAFTTHPVFPVRRSSAVRFATLLFFKVLAQASQELVLPKTSFVRFEKPSPDGMAFANRRCQRRKRKEALASPV